jgi:uncharacterized protein (TIGR02284 family)
MASSIVTALDKGERHHHSLHAASKQVHVIAITLDVIHCSRGNFPAQPGSTTRVPNGEHPIMSNDHDIKTLNSLIETTLDSADGYAEAAKDAKSALLVSLFTSRATERRATASTLQQCVRSLGGKPEDDGTVLASAHRVFVNLRASLTSNNNTAVVDEVERGEDHIKAKFEGAMKDTEVSSPIKSAITVAYTSVRSGHDQIRDIKKAMHASK